MPKAKSQKLKAKSRSAFTLMEMLVSLTLFMVVTTIAVGSFTVVLRGQRHALAVQATQDNASVLIESMARDIRTGFNFTIPAGNIIPGSPGIHGTALAFTNDEGVAVVYRLNNANLERSSNGGVSFQQISATKVLLTNFRFVLQGTTPGDNRQPTITIIARFENIGIRPEEQVAIDISTTLTQRELDET